VELEFGQSSIGTLRVAKMLNSIEFLRPLLARLQLLDHLLLALSDLIVDLFVLEVLAVRHLLLALLAYLIQPLLRMDGHVLVLLVNDLFRI